MRTITAQIPDELAQTLDQYAEQEGRSRSWLIREALTDYLVQQDELQKLTMEGMEAYRQGKLVAHSEVQAELDQWGQ